MEKKDIVIDYLQSLIAEEKIKVGDKLESENVLSKKLNVSRVVVREALSILTKNGTIEKRHGWGSLVVNTDLYRKRKYIIIDAYYRYLFDDFSNSYKYTCNILNKLVEENNYTPFFYVENPDTDLLSSIKISKNDIAGVISVLGSDETLSKIVENNIPVVRTLNHSENASVFPSISFNYKDFYHKLFSIVGDNKNVVFFNFLRPNYFPNFEFFFELGLKKYLEEEYTLFNIEFDGKSSSIEKKVKKGLSSLKKSPDILVLTDDNIYRFAKSHIDSFIKNNPKTKLLTMSTSCDINLEGDNICELRFDLDKNAEETVNLLLKLINKEPLFVSQSFINPEIINNF